MLWLIKQMKVKDRILIFKTYSVCFDPEEMHKQSLLRERNFSKK